MKQEAVKELASAVLIPRLQAERERQKVFSDWAKGKHAQPYRPREAKSEYDQLLEKARTPLIGLVVRMLTQSIQLRDYTPGDESMKDDLWRIWSANRMNIRQKRLYREVFHGGLAYSMILPGDPVPVAKIYSPRRMLAVYQDPEADEWPEYAVYREPSTATKSHFIVVDNKAIYRLGADNLGDDLEYIDHEEHRLGVTPIVRYTGEMDDEGNVEGEVERLIPIQGSIDQSKLDLLLSQTLQSWKVRFITGMEAPEGDDEKAKQKLILERDRLLLIENPEARAGTLDGAELGQYIESRRDAKQDLASVAQVPQKAILGAQANQSDGAEAQAAEEASMQRKLEDYETSFGESHQQWFRLAGHAHGIAGAFEDYEGASDFKDSSIRSMAQMADALGKLGTMLGVPKRALWAMIPNVSPDEVKRWEEIARADPYGQMLEGMHLDDSDIPAVPEG